MLLLLLIQKDRIEHAATRLLTQAQVNPEKGPEAYDEYVKIRYPYLETAKKREKEETIKQLFSEVNRGPLVINSIGGGKKKKYKTVARDAVLPPQEAGVVTSRLMSKIGRVIPT